MRFSSLQGWLGWLESCHPKEIDLGLDRIDQVAKTLSLSLDHCQVVTVAGTNGKGSCVATLNALLCSADLRVGCFTSPHLVNYNERVTLNGVPVTDQLLMDAFERIDRARGNISLSYFEFGTLAALSIFQHANLDAVVLEVGLGGRLDATNIIDADIAVVTRIDRDHESWLGSDIEQIGREKAGIFRPKKRAVSAGYDAPASIKNYADELGTQLFEAGTDFDSDTYIDEVRWCWRGMTGQGVAVELADLPPLGLHRESVSAAIQVTQLLDIPSNNINYQCLSGLSLPGRYQPLTLSGKQLRLDVAHNPAASENLSKTLKKGHWTGQTFAIVAIMADKDVEGIIEPLIPQIDVWYTVNLNDVPRAMPAEELAEVIRSLSGRNVSCGEGVPQTLNRVLPLLSEDDCLLILGSFFTVAEVLQYSSTVDREC